MCVCVCEHAGNVEEAEGASTDGEMNTGKKFITEPTVALNAPDGKAELEGC